VALTRRVAVGAVPPQTELRSYQVYTVEGVHVVYVPAGRGEELRTHLHAHGIVAAVSPLAVADHDRVEVARGILAETLQAFVDHWER
jgi:hypothetical protein